MDWSDAEAKGLREAVGDETADSILRGCNVHWARSYQRVAERVAKEKLAVEAFCKIARSDVSWKLQRNKMFISFLMSCKALQLWTSIHI